MGLRFGLIFKEGHRLRVFPNSVLRRIFQLKRDEVTGAWRELQNKDEICTLRQV
jgi:hypothetical protein